jgi:hypothetical protein
MMRLDCPWSNKLAGALASMMAAGAWTAGFLSAAEPPRIDRIEFFLTNQVTLHFDTEANRVYELQFRNVEGLVSSSWSNLYVTPRFPFPNHYIVVDNIDKRTNRARLYRLRVTP